MDIKINANETETVLEALRAYQVQLGLDIVTVEKSSETWAADSIKKRIEVKRETLNRVIARIESL